MVEPQKPGIRLGLRRLCAEFHVPYPLEVGILVEEIDHPATHAAHGRNRQLALRHPLGKGLRAERLCSRLLVLDHGRKIAEGKPRDLIAEHLEPDVVEVYGNGAVALADRADLKAMAARVEVSGETVFFYTHNASDLLQALGAHPHLRTLHRPANLEDLFLKLTGRQIREDA